MWSRRVERLAWWTLLVFPLLIFLPRCDAKNDAAYREQADIMGTVFTVTIDGYADPAPAARAAFDEIRRIDRLLSTYKDDSEITAVNRRAFEESVAVGEDFRNVAAASCMYYELSGGSFDPTVRPLMRLWGFTRKQGRIPTHDELEATLPLVDFGLVELGPQSVRFERDEMQLDFGGIAKGYAVDRALGVLKEAGVTRAIVNAGGNFYALGTPAGRDHWEAGIRHPLRHDEVIARLPVADRGVATSGNYEQFFDIGGKKYCHIMDPRTGMPVQRMLSTTIVADTAMAADALATSVFVLGEEKGMRLIEELPGVEGMLVVQDPGSPVGFRILLSSGLAGRIELLLPEASGLN
jgi:thiamine biosynthesis lipoprotein